MRFEVLAAIIIIVAAVGLAILFLAPKAATKCGFDIDCRPATCCHPDSCVPQPEAPDCAGVLCTMDCRPGTMDCGQGHCECINGDCQAVFSGEV